MRSAEPAPAPMAVVVAEAAGGLALEAVALGHRYGARRGLEAVSFRLSGPGVTAVTGPNGAGKSTLLRALAGLLRPSDGESRMTVAGNTVPAPERRRVVGFVSAELAFYEELSALENLTFAAEARGMRGARAAAGSALERVELARRADDRVAALSSGMKQRLRLAFALLHQPVFLLLDEPGSHLDDSGRALVGRIVEDERRRALVVIATNDEREWGLAGERIELAGRRLGGPA